MFTNKEIDSLEKQVEVIQLDLEQKKEYIKSERARLKSERFASLSKGDTVYTMTTQDDGGGYNYYQVWFRCTVQSKPTISGVSVKIEEMPFEHDEEKRCKHRARGQHSIYTWINKGLHHEGVGDVVNVVEKFVYFENELPELRDALL